MLINEGAMQRNRRMRAAGASRAVAESDSRLFLPLGRPSWYWCCFPSIRAGPVASFTGFTLKWYGNILNNVMGAESAFSTELMLNAFRNSLFVGTLATAISTVLGTMIALAMARAQVPRAKA